MILLKIKLTAFNVQKRTKLNIYEIIRNNSLNVMARKFGRVTVAAHKRHKTKKKVNSISNEMYPLIFVKLY